ncbi:hypothetical protein PLICRDRAFT_32214 [Plicaturopsis crispa FD-325 SS-3]|uniref:Uncharacterized protein n=1 Tax=Plicaturopsis crispa FD-325 SS-3 TaxID=944288 RepID=A0A0C9SRA6_PLICR|nr:hypothetical protein PLICRDRAFT_32214 [Plicaturopsis crispa FD-325 SS-3]
MPMETRAKNKNTHPGTVDLSSEDEYDRQNSDQELDAPKPARKKAKKETGEKREAKISALASLEQRMREKDTEARDRSSAPVTAPPRLRGGQKGGQRRVMPTITASAAESTTQGGKPAQEAAVIDSNTVEKVDDHSLNDTRMEVDCDNHEDDARVSEDHPAGAEDTVSLKRAKPAKLKLREEVHRQGGVVLALRRVTPRPAICVDNQAAGVEGPSSQPSSKKLKPFKPSGLKQGWERISSGKSRSSSNIPLAGGDRSTPTRSGKLSYSGATVNISRGLYDDVDDHVERTFLSSSQATVNSKVGRNTQQTSVKIERPRAHDKGGAKPLSRKESAGHSTSKSSSSSNENLPEQVRPVWRNVFVPTVFTYFATLEDPWNSDDDADFAGAARTIFRAVYPHLQQLLYIFDKGEAGILNRVYEWRRSFGRAAVAIVNEFMEDESNWDEDGVDIQTQRINWVTWALDNSSSADVKMPFKYKYIDDNGTPRGAFQAPFILGTLATHYQQVDKKAFDLDLDEPPRGALALSVAATGLALLMRYPV